MPSVTVLHLTAFGKTLTEFLCLTLRCHRFLLGPLRRHRCLLGGPKTAMAGTRSPGHAFGCGGAGSPGERPPSSHIASVAIKIRYQADNDLNKAIVRAVARREPALDFRSAQAARLDHVSDPEVLGGAARNGRILISHDFQTMPEHFREFVQEHHSPGVFLIPQDLPVALAVATLIATQGHG